jgi:hypothetical protein
MEGLEATATGAAGEQSLLDAVLKKTSTMMAASPPKSSEEIVKYSMPEDDANGNSAHSVVETVHPRWGPNHKGAKELQQLYSTPKRAQEVVSVVLCSVSFVINAYYLIHHFEAGR